MTAATTAAAAGAVVTAFAYDADGQLLRTEQSAGATVLRATSATHTPTGKVATATDAARRVTSFEYDAVGRQTAIRNLAIQGDPLEARGYTPDGPLASLTDAAGNVTAYAYDGFDRLDTVTYPGGTPTEHFTYDADGNVLTFTNRAGRYVCTSGFGGNCCFFAGNQGILGRRLVRPRLHPPPEFLSGPAVQSILDLTR